MSRDEMKLDKMKRFIDITGKRDKTRQDEMRKQTK